MQGSTAAAGLGDGEGAEAVLAGEGTTTGWRGRRIRAEAVLDGRGDARGRGILVARSGQRGDGDGPGTAESGRVLGEDGGCCIRDRAGAREGASLGRTTRREHREARRRDELRRRQPWLQRVALASW